MNLIKGTSVGLGFMLLLGVLVGMAAFALAARAPFWSISDWTLSFALGLLLLVITSLQLAVIFIVATRFGSMEDLLEEVKKVMVSHSRQLKSLDARQKPSHRDLAASSESVQETYEDDRRPRGSAAARAVRAYDSPSPREPSRRARDISPKNRRKSASFESKTEPEVFEPEESWFPREDPSENRKTLESYLEEGPPAGSTRDAETPSARTIGPSWAPSLISVWQDYRQNGSGFFHAKGLESFLRKHQIDATVIPGSELGGSKRLLGVTDDRGQQVYLLPNFIEPLSAMEKWFDDEGTGDRTRRVTRVGRLAVLERTADGHSLIQRGVVS